MKSVGDRIKQAREFRKITSEGLAKKVGYKTQSGISNLENRSTGHGGNKIPLIAKELDVSIKWLMSGPDTEDMTNVAPYAESIVAETPVSAYSSNTPTAAAYKLIDKLSDQGLIQAIQMLEVLAVMHPRQPADRAGLFVPASKREA